VIPTIARPDFPLTRDREIKARPPACKETPDHVVGLIKVISREANAVPVSAITRLYIAKRYGEDDVALVRRALRVAALPDSWKEYFRERLGKASV
jgi:hypothetical protein